MKSVLGFLLAICCVSSYAAPGDDYPATVHVKNSHLTKDGGQLYQRLDVVIDGHGYELAGYPLSSSIFESALLVPGDYPARVTKDEHKTAYKVTRIYELRFPDGKTEKFAMIGMSE